MGINLHPYLIILIVVAVAIAISMYSVRKIIFITRKRKVYDIPDNVRKIHGAEIPSLGGTGIFTGLVITSLLFAQPHIPRFNIIIVSTLILFFTGIYDDIMNMSPIKKLAAQLLASFLAIYFANIQLPSFQGFMGIYELPAMVNIVLTTIACTFFINVFNFIDGIDGLACMLSIFYSTIIGSLFFVNKLYPEAYWAFSLMGATLGLLYYNYAPAKIYMGDTGSMVSGFSIFLLCMVFIRQMGGVTNETSIRLVHNSSEAIIIVFALLFLPVFDAIRVFAIRISKGISPLQADRRHLHYYLLDCGFSHVQAAWLILSTQAMTSIVAFLFRDAKLWLQLPIIMIPAILIVSIAARMRVAPSTVTR